MKEEINLASNYPVLAEQQKLFDQFVPDFISNYKNWLTVAPLKEMEEINQIAAKWISGNGPAIDPQSIIVATGGHHAYLSIIIAIGLQGKSIAVEEYTYSNFINTAKMMNITLIPCASDEFGMTPDSLLAVSRENEIKGIYLMPTVSNPEGKIMPEQRRIELINIVRENQQIIIEDDAYGFLEENSPLNFAQLAPDISFYIYSLSKPIAPPIKVAFVAAPLNFKPLIENVILLITSNPSSLYTSLVIEMIKNGDLEKIIKLKQIEGNKRQAIVRSILDGYEMQAHPNAWHIWLRLPEGVTSIHFASELAKQGIRVFPGAIFKTTDIKSDEFIRIAFGNEQDMEKMISGMNIIKYGLDNCWGELVARTL